MNSYRIYCFNNISYGYTREIVGKYLYNHNKKKNKKIIASEE